MKYRAHQRRLGQESRDTGVKNQNQDENDRIAHRRAVFNNLVGGRNYWNPFCSLTTNNNNNNNTILFDGERLLLVLFYDGDLFASGRMLVSFAVPLSGIIELDCERIRIG